MSCVWPLSGKMSRLSKCPVFAKRAGPLPNTIDDTQQRGFHLTFLPEHLALMPISQIQYILRMPWSLDSNLAPRNGEDHARFVRKHRYLQKDMAVRL